MSGTGIPSANVQVGVSQDTILIYILLEPIGAKAPSFSTDSKGSIFIREMGQNFALLCQAQASPIPIYR